MQEFNIDQQEIINALINIMEDNNTNETQKAEAQLYINDLKEDLDEQLIATYNELLNIRLTVVNLEKAEKELKRARY